MGEEKRNKVIAAVTVNAILLVFILLAVVIAQIVTISVKQRHKQTLEREYNLLFQEYEAKKDFIDAMEEYEYKTRMETLILELRKNGDSEDEILKIVIPNENGQ